MVQRHRRVRTTPAVSGLCPACRSWLNGTPTIKKRLAG